MMNLAAVLLKRHKNKDALSVCDQVSVNINLTLFSEKFYSN